jgi:hypothetical protein
MVLLVILVAVVLAVVGLAVYNAQQGKPKTANTGQSSSPAQSPETSATPAPTTAYLHIKEMGIKLPLSADISDLSYYYNMTSRTAELILQPEIVILLVRAARARLSRPADRAATGDDPVVCGQPKITQWPQATA